MANTIELKKMIYSFLSGITSNVYDEKTPQKIAYPYIVYSLNYSDTNENQKMEEFELVIDVFDNNQFDSTDLDILIGQIDGDGAIAGSTGLHKKRYFDSGVLQAVFYRDNRDTIQEKNIQGKSKNIRHVELTYEVQTYLS